MKRVFAVILILAMIFTFSACGEEKKAALELYNKEAARITEEETALNTLIAECDKALETKAEPLDRETLDNLTTVLSEARSGIIELPQAKGNAEAINTLVNDNLKKVSYVEATDKLKEAKDAYDISVKQMQMVTNPSEADVISRTKDIEGIIGLEAVTEDNDPNGNLNKPGGYTATIYYRYDKVDESDLYIMPGETIVDIGTDGGAAIEVYANVDDANKRNDYLATFDGSFLNVGSHTVIGTVIVRTSDNLTATEQKELTQQFIDALTKVD